ncbi:hypothetical protein LZ519_09150 [Sphingomonas sp. RG327]|jgi:hypothetical protein|uniref:Uncharacterized protein n=1 Tax=Sphingomonas anseongensis TaxID=2908207 RepID=A0ABT0RHR0_9SPHN|nr:hypothetical protein [Sphingomonas anseongensis]MCL6679475.1 hypothetical protein [Sphingomonas anseongensis]
MRIAAVFALAGAIGLTACNSEPSAPPTKIKVHSEAQEQLHKASGLNRAIGLKRAIYDTGARCQRVTRTGYVGEYKNLDIWMASCADGRDWAIFIGPDGSAQVRDCKDVAAVGLPKCVIKSDEAGAEPVTNSSGE